MSFDIPVCEDCGSRLVNNGEEEYCPECDVTGSPAVDFS